MPKMRPVQPGAGSTRNWPEERRRPSECEDRRDRDRDTSADGCFIAEETIAILRRNYKHGKDRRESKRRWTFVNSEERKYTY